jgi:hypothetical protein
MRQTYAGGDTLGQNAGATLNCPGNQSLSDSLVVLLGDSDKISLLLKRGVGGSKRRVGGHVDTLGSAVFKQLGLGKVSYDLYIVSACYLNPRSFYKKRGFTHDEVQLG